MNYIFIAISKMKKMSNHQNLNIIDRRAFLAALGFDIDTERNRLASELRQLLNERRRSNPKSKTIEVPNPRLKT
jgi:recombinational DNA repair ATPase RecF